MMFYKRFPSVSRLVKGNFLVAFFALTVGGVFGLIQALHRTGYYEKIVGEKLVTSSDYYTVLTGHGVLLALVFTFEQTRPAGNFI